MSAVCPRCEEPRGAADGFCGKCGFSFRGAARGWHAIVTANRSQFEKFAPDRVAFPVDHEPWTLAFSSDRFTLGRQTLPGDPGISRRHADIVITGESCSIVDLESMNGTTLNDELSPLAPNVPVPLREGDRVHVGAWTTLTIHAPKEEDDDDD